MRQSQTPSNPSIQQTNVGAPRHNGSILPADKRSKRVDRHTAEPTSDNAPHAEKSVPHHPCHHPCRELRETTQQHPPRVKKLPDTTSFCGIDLKGNSYAAVSTLRASKHGKRRHQPPLPAPPKNAKSVYVYGVYASTTRRGAVVYAMRSTPKRRPPTSFVEQVLAPYFRGPLLIHRIAPRQTKRA